MKKFIFISLSICLMFGAIACTNNDIEDKKETQNAETVEELNFKTLYFLYLLLTCDNVSLRFT